MLLRTVGKTMNIDECSDVFVFSTDGSYKIFNDCYGQNKKEPIVESGKWKVSESKIYFNDRKFTSNYTLYSVNKSVVLTITSLTADSLKINFNGNEQFFKKMKSRK